MARIRKATIGAILLLTTGLSVAASCQTVPTEIERNREVAYAVLSDTRAQVDALEEKIAKARIEVAEADNPQELAAAQRELDTLIESHRIMVRSLSIAEDYVEQAETVAGQYANDPASGIGSAVTSIGVATGQPWLVLGGAMIPALGGLAAAIQQRFRRKRAEQAAVDAWEAAEDYEAERDQYEQIGREIVTGIQKAQTTNSDNPRGAGQGVVDFDDPRHQRVLLAHYSDAARQFVKDIREEGEGK